MPDKPEDDETEQTPEPTPEPEPRYEPDLPGDGLFGIL